MSELLEYWIRVLVTPAALGVLIFVFQKAMKLMKERSNSETLTEYIGQFEKCVQTAVLYMNQTYVDTLKNKGEFTKEAQKEALDNALQLTYNLLSKEAEEFMKSIHEDLDEYLRVLIEAEVKSQKVQAN